MNVSGRPEAQQGGRRSPTGVDSGYPLGANLDMLLPGRRSDISIQREGSRSDVGREPFATGRAPASVRVVRASGCARRADSRSRPSRLSGRPSVGVPPRRWGARRTFGQLSKTRSVVLSTIWSNSSRFIGHSPNGQGRETVIPTARPGQPPGMSA